MTNTVKSTVFVISIACLIAGNLIGAGILALPINTGLAGLIPSLFVMVVFGCAMFFSAVILGKEAVETRQENFNYPSLYERYLGVTGKWIASLTNLLILYGLLTAYITGGSTIMTSLLGYKTSPWWLMLIFAGVLSVITAADLSIVKKYNVLLIVAMITAFVILCFMGSEDIHVGRLARSDWLFLPAAVPIVITAFHFHNIIPTICRDMNWNLSLIWKAMLLGMAIGFILNAVWVTIGIGVLPLEGDTSLLAAFTDNQPATVPMSAIIHSRAFTFCAVMFSLIAITTSYMANGIGLMDFVRDIGENSFKVKSKIFVIAGTFAPPLLISLIWPDIFLKALNIVGGVGIVVLFGILPAILAWRKNESRNMRILSGIMLLLFGLGMLFEIGQEFGLLHIQPDVEHWTHMIK